MTYYFFFFNDTATTEIYTLSLHDALPIFGPVGALPRRAGGQALPPGLPPRAARARAQCRRGRAPAVQRQHVPGRRPRSEEHTSELQSRQYLVCRLLLEKKKNITTV